MDPDVAEADHPGPVLPSQRGPLVTGMPISFDSLTM